MQTKTHFTLDDVVDNITYVIVTLWQMVNSKNIVDMVLASFRTQHDAREKRHEHECRLAAKQ